jgi:glycosyltransferase involved in cell wall biosynthesis
MVQRSNRSEPVPTTPQEHQRLTVLAIYGWREFWSMGEGRGAPSFFLSITSFPKRGHDMHVLMPGRPGCPREEDYHGVTLHRFRSAINFMPEPGASKALQHIKRLLTYVYWFVRVVPAGKSLASRLGADVVIGMGELGAQAAFRIARGAGVPNVTRLFGIGVFPASKLKFMLRYRETRALTTPAAYIILCNDGSQGDELARRLGVDTDRLLFWPNGVDKRLYESPKPSRDIRAELGMPESNRIVLSISRLHFEKHIERIVRAVPGVAAARDDVTFVIVGSGEERESLERLADSLGVRDRVVFTGSVGREELADYYKTADVFVALSDRTNVSNSLHEAMIAGLPVVVLNTGRTADVVQNGENGVLLTPADLPRVHEVLLELLADDERRRVLGEGARTSADERLPTLEERQVMEAGVAERAVRERAGSDPR